MGEPLANYKAVIGACSPVDHANTGRSWAQRPRHHDLHCRAGATDAAACQEGIPLTLALSLHAPDDELRDELVPINTRWNVEEVINAAWDYAATTKRRVSIEYILIRDINDQPSRAEQLAKVLRRVVATGVGCTSTSFR
jgi:23S rRNA (adenine2503-C2)-methyltransferase